MLTNYPKTRPVLSDDYQKIYNEHYYNNREGTTTASFLTTMMESWLHKKVAKDIKNSENKSTLEIGAGTLNQLDYENTKPYDIIEPFTELYKNSKNLSKVNSIYKDIDEIEMSQKYDRITSIATFEHITDLPKVVAKTGLLLKKGGTLRVSIPNEGTILWKLGWKLTSGIEFRLKYKLKYETLLKYEHVNNASEIEEVLKHFYTNVKCSCFGLSRRFAFYRFYECSEPRIDVAADYLK